jgi:hypothetical protein
MARAPPSSLITAICRILFKGLVYATEVPILYVAHKKGFSNKIWRQTGDSQSYPP